MGVTPPLAVAPLTEEDDSAMKPERRRHRPQLQGKLSITSKLKVSLKGATCIKNLLDSCGMLRGMYKEFT